MRSVVILFFSQVPVFYIENLLTIYSLFGTLDMSDKKEIQKPGLNTEDAKELELDEKPKPTRKVSHPATPISDKEEPSTHDRRKGRRMIK
jgi:hypothetical protein